ncbi:MAG: RNA methyltransferase substrate-binding domain-containing protein, partial [Cyanobacteriota bacterium]|nr:RNA methyltransferase substrate-binding domain-containing protein [Cyanobacteriota bacterium]
MRKDSARSRSHSKDKPSQPKRPSRLEQSSAQLDSEKAAENDLDLIYGRHPVLAALEKGRSLNRIWMIP